MTDHILRIGRDEETFDVSPDPASVRTRIEPWLSAVLQSEHLAVLLGSGFTTAVSGLAGEAAPGMGSTHFDAPLAAEVDSAARSSADRLGRGAPNIEDQIRAALQLMGGLDVMGDDRAQQWRTELDR